MNCISFFVIDFLVGAFRSRLSLQLEIAALRHQLSHYQRPQQRPAVAPSDRFRQRRGRVTFGGHARGGRLPSLRGAPCPALPSELRRPCAPMGHGALFFVQPRTVILWQRKRFRDYWRGLSCGDCRGRPPIPLELRRLMSCRMWQANQPRTILGENARLLAGRVAGIAGGELIRRKKLELGELKKLDAVSLMRTSLQSVQVQVPQAAS